jgi:CRP-like cAMP-binding protein
MLQKDPGVRYGSFKDILEDISEFCNSGQAFSTRTYKPGEILFREGDAGDFAFEILLGAVEVIKSVEGKEKVLARLKKGEIVGELAIFAGQPRTATVRAVEPTAIRVMDKASVEKELDKLSPWVGKMITSLSNRFIEINEKLAQIQK